MNIKLISSLLFLIVSLSFSFSQEKFFERLQDIVDPDYQNPELWEGQKIDPDDVVGSLYLFPFWSHGYIITFHDQKFENIELKFDIYFNNLIYNDNGKERVALKGVIKEFGIEDSYQNRIRRFRLIRLLDKKKRLFCEVLYDTRLNLFMLTEANLQHKGPSPYGNTKSTYKINKVSTYYVIGDDGTFIRMRLNKSSVINGLYLKKSEIQNFIKKEKIKFKSEAELTKVIEFYDSIIQN